MLLYDLEQDERLDTLPDVAGLIAACRKLRPRVSSYSQLQRLAQQAIQETYAAKSDNRAGHGKPVRSEAALFIHNLTKSTAKAA